MRRRKLLVVLADAWRTPAAPTPTYLATSVDRGRMCGGPGRWTWCWGRVEAQSPLLGAFCMTRAVSDILADIHRFPPPTDILRGWRPFAELVTELQVAGGLPGAVPDLLRYFEEHPT